MSETSQSFYSSDGGGAKVAPASRASVVAWGAYLAVSWTWCIGMFLPVLLVRDYGIWGFVVFAVPNVIGAGAMGWVLTSASSTRIVERHRTSIRAFSVVTVAFQFFFCFWLLGLTGNRPVPPLLFGLVFLAIPVSCAATIGFSRYSGLSVLILLLSLGLMGEFARQGGFSAAHVRSSLGPENSGVWFLAPVCVFGFALCPYLDYTFHRARQQAPGGSGRVAFTLGFGFFFLLMILFTLAYAWVFTAPSRGEQWSRVEPLVSMHIIVQITFTIMAHTLGYLTERSSKRLKREPFSIGRFVGAMAIGFVLFGGPLLAVFAFENRTYAGMSVAEIIYRGFMSFYGLVFPAYVWLCMIPTADGHSGIEGAQGRRKLVVLGVACALAAPCYWMGFIERVEWWLAPGLGVVLLARLVVRGSASGAAMK